jgi:hypothetical protein
MKASRLIKYILVFYTSACAGKTPAGTPGPFAIGRVIDSVICRSDPSQSYALYIPARGNKEALPVLYFFDPHGDGALPLNKYKSLADAYGYILVGSNNSKNGNDWPTTENIWLRLSGDTKSRLRIGSDRIYTVGFSGGAKVASYLALNHPGVRGVIAGGAGLPDETPAGDFNFTFTAIAGRGDMNMTDLVAISRELDKTRTRHRIILFDGKHEWAPVGTMNLAFSGLQFDAMGKGLLPKDKAFISHYTTGSKKRLDSYTQTNQLIKAEQECQLSIRLLDGLTDEVRWFREKAATLEGNPLYQKQRQAQENLLAREQKTKAGYAQHFQQDDMPYWNKTIASLRAGASAKTDEGAMYQRLLAYLSLAFYSLSNHFINSNENQGARHFAGLYKLADPTNSEAWYFSAILNVRDGQAKAAEEDLQKAVHYGFRDRRRMMQQPEFKSLSTRISF